MKLQDILSIGTGCLEVLLFAGNIFGFFTLHFVLEEEDYFADQCNLTSTNITQLDKDHPSLCKEQEASFNLAFTLGVSLMLFLSFPLGFFFDRYGTWIFRTFATTMFSLGYLLLAVSSPNNSNLIYPALIFIGLGGISLLASNIQIANFSVTARGLIVTLINGLFDSSVVVFFVLKKLYEANINFNKIIWILTGLTVFLWLRTYILMPKRRVPYPRPIHQFNYGWKEWKCFKKPAVAAENNETSKSKEVSLETLPAKVSENPISHSLTFKDCLKVPVFWTNVLHFSLLSFRANMFVGTFQVWLKGFASATEVSHFTDVVGYLLMLGVFAAPLNGFLIDLVTKKLKNSAISRRVLNLKAFMVSMFVTCVLGVILSITIVIPTTYASFVFMLLTRSFIFGGNAAFLSIVFPIEQFGKLFGVTNFAAGIVSLLQYPITLISLAVDPKYHYINIALLIATTASLIHPLAIFITIRKSRPNTAKFVESSALELPKTAL